jgi:hypothetical protein
VIKMSERKGRTYCWFCGAEMIWGGDHSFEDVGLEGEGIVANMSCSNEECGATAEFTTKLSEDEPAPQDTEDPNMVYLQQQSARSNRNHYNGY